MEEAPGQEEKLDALESARRAPGPRIEGCLSYPRNVVGFFIRVGFREARK